MNFWDNAFCSQLYFKMLTYEIVIPLRTYLKDTTATCDQKAPRNLYGKENGWNHLEPFLNRQAGNTDEILVMHGNATM